MLGTVKLENTILTCDQRNFSQIIGLSLKLKPCHPAVVSDTCSTTVPPAPPGTKSNLHNRKLYSLVNEQDLLQNYISY